MPAIQLWGEDGRRIWINGREGPLVDSIAADNAYWGAQLEDSRYAVTFEGQKYIAGDTLKHGPFDFISDIRLMDLEAEGSWIWTGRIGNMHHLYVNALTFSPPNIFRS